MTNSTLQADSTDTQSTIPDNTTFAEEVKLDRLKALYRSTGVLSLILLIGTLAVSDFIGNSTPNLIYWDIALAWIAIGSLVTRYFTKKEDLQTASWVYTLNLITGLSIMLYQPSELMIEVLPFAFPLVIFIGGLLLSPTSTFITMAISAGTVLFVPMLNNPEFTFVGQQGFSILFMFLSATLAAQVTGELYQITQWALLNYQRERKTNEELFDKRRELQLSLRRSEILREELHDTNEELEVAHREAEEAKHFRGQFLANMSHELRTPLNAIIGFSETMLEFPIMYDNEKLPDAYKEDLSQIYNSGRQLLHVINDILDLAKVDAGKLEIHLQPVNPEPIIEAITATSKGLLGSKPVELKEDIPDDIPTVWADDTRLRQVLLNIYSNACKYTDEGHIKLSIDTIDDANKLQFAIKDTGVGVDPEYHDTLFEEFQQATNRGRDPRSGTGLGLAISSQLLHLMGGEIWMESTVGEGSTFYFTLPIYDDQDQRDAKSSQPREVSLKETDAISHTEPAAAKHAEQETVE